MEVVGSLGDLPPQPLPSPDLVGGVFVTIWLFTVLGSVYYLTKKIWFKKKKTWEEFKTVLYGCALLAL